MSRKKPYSSHKQFRLSEPFLPRTGKNHHELQIPRYQPQDTLVADLSEDSSLRPAFFIYNRHTMYLLTSPILSFILFIFSSFTLIIIHSEVLLCYNI